MIQPPLNGLIDVSFQPLGEVVDGFILVVYVVLKVGVRFKVLLCFNHGVQ
jgi:hypothetical protein